MHDLSARIRSCLLGVLLSTTAALLPAAAHGATNISTINISQGNIAIQLCGTGCVQILQQYNIAIVSVNQGGLDFVGAGYISPTAYDFGAVVHSKSFDFTLTNTSAIQPLIVPPGSIGLSGANPGDFTQSNNCTTVVVLLPGQRCVIHVTFAPTAAGARSAVLAVRNSAIDSPEKVDLAGFGATPTLTPAALDFGSVGIGVTAGPQYLTLRNPGTDTLGVTSVSMTGPNAPDFGEGACSSVAGGGSCMVAVTFTPADAGPRAAVLGVATNWFGGSLSAALAGTGVPLSVSPVALDFHQVLVGGSAGPLDLTLRNGGSAPAVLGSISGTEGSDFRVTGSCGPLPATLAGGAACALHVTFAPSATGPRSATVSIKYTAAGQAFAASAVVAGVGIAPAFSLSPAALDFGTVTVGGSAARSATLSNPGTAPMTVSAIVLAGAGSGAFTRGGTCPVAPPFDLGPGASCSIDLVFAPTAAGDFALNLKVTDSAPGSPHLLPISAGAVAAASAASNPPAVSPAPVAVLMSVPGLPNTGAPAPPETAAGTAGGPAGRAPGPGVLGVLGVLLLAAVLLGWRRRSRQH